MKCVLWVMVIAALSVQAEIMVSIESNGVLRVEGMEPGTTCTVEWASELSGGFTNNPSPFSGLVADGQGHVQVSLPMFFRVSGTPAVPPDGMVEIPAGTNAGMDPDFGEYSLTIESFYMDSTEVTKSAWDVVRVWALANGYDFSNAGMGKAGDHPVHTVNWYDCVKWCNARSEMEGRSPCYTSDGSVYKSGESTVSCDFGANGYRLPTRDEWQYAARGGLSGYRFPWGNIISHSFANYYGSSAMTYDDSDGFHPDYEQGALPYTGPVGSFPANEYGLYDMCGNIGEWCWNSSAGTRAVQGGNWLDFANDARIGTVKGGIPGNAYYALGFRSVCR